MAVRIRLTRVGARNRPYYRIGAYDGRTKRDGKSIEILGAYHPLESDEQKRLQVNLERVDHWIQNGALPTDAVASLLKRAKKAAAKSSA